MGVFALALAVFLVLIPVVGLRVAPAAFGLLGLTGLTPLLFRKKADPAEVMEDERDKRIARLATLGAGIASFEAVVLACMATWSVYMFQGKEVITVHALPLVLGAAAIVFWVTESVAKLVMYGREPSHVED